MLASSYVSRSKSMGTEISAHPSGFSTRYSSQIACRSCSICSSTWIQMMASNDSDSNGMSVISTQCGACGRPSRSTPTNSMWGILVNRRDRAYFGETCNNRMGSENRLVFSCRYSQSLRCRAFELQRGQYPLGLTLIDVPPCVKARNLHPQHGQTCRLPANRSARHARAGSIQALLVDLRAELNSSLITAQLSGTLVVLWLGVTTIRFFLFFGESKDRTAPAQS